MKSFSIFAPAISYLIGATGEMAEWSNAAVLKTVDCYRSGGSNPSFSAIIYSKLAKVLQTLCL